MKTRFNTFDIVCGVTEMQRLVGSRVNQIYDIDNKTYLLRFQASESKTMLLIESGIRFHTTAFEWPKNVAPSGFSMKLRKHLKNKRLESLSQLGADRIVDFQFGVGQAAYHVIVELYDRGNIILTDHELMILYLLRPHSEGEEIRLAVREKYPINRAKERKPRPTEDEIRIYLENAPGGESLNQLLMHLLDCGPAVIEHAVTKYNLNGCIIKSNENQSNDLEIKKSSRQKKKAAINSQRFYIESDLYNLMAAVKEADNILENARNQPMKGYIIQKKEERPSADGVSVEYFHQNLEYHPYIFDQYKSKPHVVFESFMLAVDEFYSTMEGQKIDMKAIQQERDALKKLSNVKKDHVKRLEDLSKAQENDKLKAELITRNQGLVDKAILAIRSAIANQMSWTDIHDLVKASQPDDIVAGSIKQLKLQINHISLSLSDPYQTASCVKESNISSGDDDELIPTMIVDVDLALSAWANARKYYDKKRSAAQKEQKTLEASQKALKSAKRKTQQKLKDVRTISTITKVRKVYWFEKFYWFISSENYLVIGGRDAQQNELIVKRYMRSSDIYVHAEVQGASSVIIRNPTGYEIPPKTLLEAGTMAISYSVVWDAKVVTNAYWVHADQVSKTAPTGEYLGTGSFMVRGKKNFLPPCNLIMGLSVLFKLEDSFIEKHQGERRIRSPQDDLGELCVKDFIAHRKKSESLEEEQDLEIALEEIDEDLSVDKSFKEIKNEGIDISQQNSSSPCEKEIQFPDTQVKIEHDTGQVTVLQTQLYVNNEIATVKDCIEANGYDNSELLPNEEDTTIITAAPSKKKQQLNLKKKQAKHTNKGDEVKKREQLQQQSINASKCNISQLKRGHKAKLKKIKLKYKDQDDEERELRMQILKSGGKSKSATVHFEAEEEMVKENKNISKVPKDPQPQIDVDDNENVPVGADVEVINSLTGLPFEEDELMFAVPVVAPYQALQNYKFKVKLTPGTGKRGRAAKIALTIFSKDKACTSRENDLLKCIKEETLARNIPGKVKLSAPQLQKFKK